jgi:hypothetical protein
MLKQTNKQAPSAFVQQRKHRNPPKNFQKFLSSSSSSSSSTTTAAVVSVSQNNKLLKLLYESLPWGPKKKKKIPTTLNCCNCRIKQKTTKPQSKQEGKICNHNCTPKITPQLHKLLKQFIHKTKQNKTKQKNHPQFTNKVTNFSPNLLASLKFFGRTELRGQFFC